MRIQSIAIVLIGAAVASAPDLAWAQQTAGAALEEIVVTARKREEALMKTPVSITAFNADTLAEMNVTSMHQIADQTPGLVFVNSSNISGSSNASSVFIRGIGQSDYTLAVEPGVGIYVDDIYLPHSIGNVVNLVDVERVEVLRGPQGTLFGRNTIGGAIRVVTKKPHDEYEGDIEFITGSYSRVDLKGHVNIPITDTLFVSFSGMSEDRNGFVDRPFLDGDSGDKDGVTVLGQARWLPTDNVTADLSIGFERDDSEGAPQVALKQNPTHPAGVQPQRFRDFIAPFVDPAVLNGMLQGFTPQAIMDPDGDNFVSFTNTDIPSDLEGFNVDLTLQWQINDQLALKSISSFRTLESRFGRDADNLPFNQQVELFLSVDYDVWSQEVQLTGNSFGDRLEWTLGGYYFYEDGVEDDRVNFASFDINSGGFFTTEDFAAFGQGTFHITDQLALTAGFRYTDEEKKTKIDGARHQSLLTGFITSLAPQGSKANTTFPAPLPFPLVGTGTFKDDLNEWTPYVNLAYEWNEDLMVYATYSEGFKGGGVQVRNGAIRFLPMFGPESVDSYEFGFKWSGFDNRLNISAAGFFINYDDVQLPGIVFQPEIGNAVSVVDNLGDANNDGFEIELTALPVPNLKFSAGVAYLDAEYRSVKPNNAGDVLDPSSAITEDDKLPNTPEWQLNGSLSYGISTRVGTFTPRVDVAYSDEQFNDAINSESIKRDSYTNLNLSLEFTDASERWNAAVFVTNALDEQYVIAGFDGFNYADGTISRPREWGLRIKRSF